MNTNTKSCDDNSDHNHEISNNNNFTASSTSVGDHKFTLSTFINKFNNDEPCTFNNFSINCNNVTENPIDSKNYLKNHISLYNAKPISKNYFETTANNLHLKPCYFEKFTYETLFYIFYAP